MAKDDAAPLTGHAAWLAARKEIAKRNDAARARGREARRLREEGAAARRLEQERADRGNAPKHGRH
jgi:hypothetical protein